MSVVFGARQLRRFLTNLVAIAAVSAIFAAKAMDASVQASATSGGEKATQIATAPAHQD